MKPTPITLLLPLSKARFEADPKRFLGMTDCPVGERYELFTRIRQCYYEVLSFQRRVTVLDELVRLASQAYENASKLLAGKVIAELDVLPIEVERDRLQTELEVTRRKQIAAWRRLTASIGVPQLPETTLDGSLKAPLPVYGFERARDFILEEHPDARSSQVRGTHAKLAIRREEVEPIPSVTLSAGYQQNFNDCQSQAMYQVAIPVPLFNRNQGNIRAAQTELGRATHEVDRVRNNLINRLAAAFGPYSSAQQQAEHYRTSILPNVRKAYQPSLDTFKGGQFEYLRVIQTQRAVAEANLEYLRSLSEAWRAASEIASLFLQEMWPAYLVGPRVTKPDGTGIERGSGSVV